MSPELLQVLLQQLSQQPPAQGPGGEQEVGAAMQADAASNSLLQQVTGGRGGRGPTQCYFQEYCLVTSKSS